MAEIVAPHKQDLPKLVVERGSRICFLLGYEHVAGQFGYGLHTAADILQVLVLLFELFNDRVLLGHVRCGDLVVSLIKT